MDFSTREYGGSSFLAINEGTSSYR
jgi:hypothetical protein